MRGVFAPRLAKVPVQEALRYDRGQVWNVTVPTPLSSLPDPANPNGALAGAVHRVA